MSDVRPQRIDELSRRNHYFLNEQDTCYFFGEYSSRNGQPFGITSTLIRDLLHPASPAIAAQDTLKDKAMGRAAKWFRDAFDRDEIAKVTFVPLPQSGAGVVTDNDDRMFRILRRMGVGLDIRKLLEMTGSAATSEFGSIRSGPDVIYENMRVVLGLTEPQPKLIVLVDDLLTTGANYVAAKRRLQQLMADVPVCGFFIARKLLDSDGIVGPQ